ncbi:AcrB/AcrD/AcrF family protein [Sphingomicrobium nitratireducens]|uniref:AcrB/AcrD/AcrF family protein n=1 Tax=Sphingomicrobium nitratireducens TaxID=2964666 RepID=UPI00223EE41C|nr:AcrB/AcrD/AcrF family protein [Sphingomicrobium nitratireducens]
MIEWTRRHWMAGVLLLWLLFAVVMLVLRYHWLADLQLGDTDDNTRLAQVRDWLGGQGWYDLRQYRMEPPGGANIHWSRLADLPIAGLILLLSPMLGGVLAEQWAVALAPFVPGLIAAFAIALTVRRLVASEAWPLAMVALFFASAVSTNFMPLRIDHHNWQLAFLALAMAGLSDRNPARGGAVLGLATALSLGVGLEMILFLALLGAGAVMSWTFFAEQRGRLLAYGAATAGGTAVSYLVFASQANRGAVCDALSSVWLSDALVGGALLVAIGWKSSARWQVRLALAVGAAMVLAAFHAFAFPHCLQRLEGVSEAADRLWLSNVREAKPAFDMSLSSQMRLMSLPLIGVTGYVLLFLRARREGRPLRSTIAIGLATLLGFLLAFWQVRVVAAAQLLALPGAVGFLWMLVPMTWTSKRALVRVLGTSVVAVMGLGALPLLAGEYLPKSKDEQTEVEEAAAGSVSRKACSTRTNMAPIAALPAGHVYTFIDMAPRLVVMTPHTTVTGPYHRNDDEIVAVFETLRAKPDEARARLADAKADYLLLCRAHIALFDRESDRTRGTLVARLSAGERFDWLEEIALPEGNPNRVWKLR